MPVGSNAAALPRKEGRTSTLHGLLHGPDRLFVRESDLIDKDPSMDVSATVLPFTVVAGSLTTICNLWSMVMK